MVRQNTERVENVFALSQICSKFDAFQVVDIKNIINVASNAALKIPMESFWMKEVRLC